MRLRSKILLAALIPLLLSSSFAISRFVSLAQAKEVELNLLRELSGNMLDSRVSQLKSQARETVRILAIPSETAAATLNNDADFLYRWAAAFLGSHIDVIVITDRSGIVLARGHDEFKFGDSYADHPAYRAMSSGLSYYEGMLKISDEYYFVSSIAIKLYGEKIVGYIVAGKRIDAPYLDQLGSELGLELYFPLSQAPGPLWLPGPSFDEHGGNETVLAYRHPGSALEKELQTATRDSILVTLLLLVLMPVLLIVVMVLSLKPYSRLTALLQDYSNHTIGFNPLHQACTQLALTADHETASLARAMADMTATVSRTMEQLAARQLELEHLSRYDVLTGIPNRRAIDELIDAETARSRRYFSPLSLIMLDIDRFKFVNDEYGHPEGDKILQKTASILQERIRKTDTCGRWGGEEFIIILPNTRQGDAALVAEAIRTAVEHEVSIGQSAKTLTVSLGVAEFDPLASGSDLIRAADGALYQAKGSGRNKVCLADTK